MAFLDGTIVIVALPSIQSQLDTNIAGIQWVVNSYALMLAALLLIGGSLGDHLGRRKVFVYGIILFTIGSALCAVSSNIEQLITFRAIQGIGAAAMIPGSLAIISTSFSENQRGRAIGLWAGLAGGVASIGPFIGGWLVQTVSWQSIFYINIPLGILTVYIAVRHITENRNPDAKRIDWTGTATITGALLGLSYGFIQGPVMGWTDPLVTGSLIIGGILLPTFLMVEARSREPMVPLGMFRNPLIAGANTVTFFLYMALNIVIFFAVLDFQQIQGYSPIMAGLALLPTIILITFLSGWGGTIADKIGPRLPMIIGPMIVAVGMGLLSMMGTEASYVRDILPGLLLLGLGMALVIAPLTKTALAVDNEFSGVASGVNNAVSRISALMAVAVLGAVLISAFTGQLSSELAESGLSSDKQQIVLDQADRLGAIEAPAEFDPSEAVMTQEAVKNSFADAFRWLRDPGRHPRYVRVFSHESCGTRINPKIPLGAREACLLPPTGQEIPSTWPALQAGRNLQGKTAP